MNKTPIQIIEITSQSGKITKEIKIDFRDFLELGSNTSQIIIDFKNSYLTLIEDAEKLFFNDNKEKKRTQNLSSSTCWKLGKLFDDFNKNIKNKFEITNYAEALERDFGRSASYIREIITFYKLFKKTEIFDNIPMAVYRALVWKKNELDSVGILEQEINRLIDMGKKGETIGREKYKKFLIEQIQKTKSL